MQGGIQANFISDTLCVGALGELHRIEKCINSNKGWRGKSRYGKMDFVLSKLQIVGKRLPDALLRRILRPSSGSQKPTGHRFAIPGLVISYPLSISDRCFMKVRTLGHIYSPKLPCWILYADASLTTNQGKRNQIASFQRPLEQW